MRGVQDLIIPEKLPEVKYKNNITETFNLGLVTPLMGGGTENGKFCKSMPVRAPSIRGTLREWWRVFCAHDKSGDDLRDAEAEIWGCVEKTKSKVSSVSINVKCQEVTEERDCNKNFDFTTNTLPELYALFPAVPNNKENNQGNNIIKEGIEKISKGKPDLKGGLKFTLSITYPEKFREQIYTALSGWVNFGGIGSRTRRGLGTLRVLSVDKNLPGIRALLSANSAIKLFTRPSNSPLEAWVNVLELYRDYRQQRDGAGTKNPGRSYFPEPDSLRMITHTYSPGHAIKLDKKFLPSFPRAALGLPIIFHFKDEKYGDPEQIIVKPENFERMSSPVITKAIFMDNQWYSAVIIMPIYNVTPVPYKVKTGSAISSSGLLNVKDTVYKNLPNNPMKSADNAIDGFINYIIMNKFSEFKP